MWGNSDNSSPYASQFDVTMYPGQGTVLGLSIPNRVWTESGSHVGIVEGILGNAYPPDYAIYLPVIVEEICVI